MKSWRGGKEKVSVQSFQRFGEGAQVVWGGVERRERLERETIAT